MKNKKRLKGGAGAKERNIQRKIDSVNTYVAGLPVLVSQDPFAVHEGCEYWL